MTRADRALRWLRIHDLSPAADVDSTARYLKESSDDGSTWDLPRESTGVHLRHDMTEALLAGRAVEHGPSVTIIQGPYPIGGLIRYTRTH
ncbi:hypothetical protein [Streptomyces pacificus]|uniref:Uncharacterized protein n=1 Tax=Streptomyces pacificus TaxID=2705029 RepID=A0A6A0AVA3_9ACTN|nr:hypothetical protein [Streptomyces pacificus]GFH36618.1 hypothetical protein SCWH03_28490 [Streptomyces pacificus]